MVRQRALLFERLKIAESMRSFISHCLGGSEDLRSILKRLEADLTTAQKAIADGVEALKKAKEEMEAFQIEAEKLRKESKVVEAKLKEVEQENSQSNNEVDELRTAFVAQKKKIEELRVGFAA